MARMPGATWRPLGDPASQPRMTGHDIICIHTMVGSLWGTDGYFRQGGFGGTESHFGTGFDGEILQWQDTDYSADANYRGSRHIISVENADVGEGFPKWNLNDGSAVPAFTAAQIEANARIVAWACKTYNIPCELIPDSKPGRRGVGYHRQGVPGYMVPGGEQWSTAAGKVCPGNRRIAQIPQIIARARQILGGAIEEDFMTTPISKANLDAIAAAVVERDVVGTKPLYVAVQEMYADLNTLVASNAALTKLVAEQNGLTLEDVRRVMAEEIAKGVKVDVEVGARDDQPAG